MARLGEAPPRGGGPGEGGRRDGGRELRSGVWPIRRTAWRPREALMAEKGREREKRVRERERE